MNGEDILKLIGFLVVAIFVIHYFIGCVHVQTSVIEGLTNADTNTDTNSTSTTTDPSNGVAGSAANYAASIKAKTVQLQDELLISKYRKDYESAIINMDDYINIMMLKQVLSMNSSNTNQKANIEMLNTLTMLKNSKDALNTTMKFLDTQ
jgi:hypothetical protein